MKQTNITDFIMKKKKKKKMKRRKQMNLIDGLGHCIISVQKAKTQRDTYRIVFEVKVDRRKQPRGQRFGRSSKPPPPPHCE